MSASRPDVATIGVGLYAMPSVVIRAGLPALVSRVRVGGSAALVEVGPAVATRRTAIASESFDLASTNAPAWTAPLDVDPPMTSLPSFVGKLTVRSEPPVGSRARADDHVSETRVEGRRYTLCY